MRPIEGWNSYPVFRLITCLPTKGTRWVPSQALLWIILRLLSDQTTTRLAVFRPLYCTLVRPHLEFAIQVTSPHSKKYIYHFERFQRLAARMEKGLHELPHIQRLHRRKLMPPDLNRAHGIFHGRYDLPQDIFFILPCCSHLRGHNLKLRHRSFHLARWKAAISVSIVESWDKKRPLVNGSLH